jgi:hypothetical protein
LVITSVVCLGLGTPAMRLGGPCARPLGGLPLRPRGFLHMSAPWEKPHGSRMEEHVRWVVAGWVVASMSVVAKPERKSAHHWQSVSASTISPHLGPSESSPKPPHQDPICRGGPHAQQRIVSGWDALSAGMVRCASPDSRERPSWGSLCCCPASCETGPRGGITLLFGCLSCSPWLTCSCAQCAGSLARPLYRCGRIQWLAEARAKRPQQTVGTRSTWAQVLVYLLLCDPSAYGLVLPSAHKSTCGDKPDMACVLIFL